MPRHQKLSSFLHAASWALIGAMPVAVIYAVATGHFSAEALTERFSTLVLSDDLDTWQVSSAALIVLIPWMAALWLLWQIRGLFDLYRRGLGLTQAAASAIRTIGIGLVALGLINIVANTAMTLILSAQNPAGERVLALTLGAAEIGFLFAGGLMVAIGQSMKEAVTAAEELRGFV